MTTANLYKHSGKVTFRGLLAGAAVALIGGPILGGIYAVAIAYIPIVYLNALLTGAFGGAMGFGIAFAMTENKVRNTWLVVITAFVGTALAHYVGWMVWMAVLYFRSDVEVPIFAIVFPITFMEMVVHVSHEGAWTIGSSGTAPTGAVLWVVWSIEAAIVFGVSAVVAFGVASGQPFCESCEQWCVSQAATLKLSGHLDGEALKERLLALDLSALAEASRADPSEPSWYQIDVALCDSCGGTNTLNLDRVSVTYDKKGQPKEKRDALVFRMLISREQASWIESVGAAPSPQPVVG